MIRSLLAGALVLIGANCAFAERTLREKLTGYDDKRTPVETPADFRDWAGTRIESLKEDMQALDGRLDNYSVERREKARARVSGLKERLSKTEGRLEEVGDEQNKAAWKTRESIREEISDVREDLQDVRGDLRRK